MHALCMECTARMGLCFAVLTSLNYWYTLTITRLCTFCIFTHLIMYFCLFMYCLEYIYSEYNIHSLPPSLPPLPQLRRRDHGGWIGLWKKKSWPHQMMIWRRWWRNSLVRTSFIIICVCTCTKSSTVFLTSFEWLIMYTVTREME